MGALTSNRQRGNDFPSFNYKTLVSNSPNFDHIPKKPKFSVNETLIPLLPVKSTVQKFLKYPGPINQIRREVHGPCRNSRLGSKSNSSILNYNNSVISVPEMGNLLKRKYDVIRRSALDLVRCFKDDKEVIDSEEVEARVCDRSDHVGHWKETEGYVEIRRNGLDSLRCFENDKEVIEIEEMEARVCNRSDLFRQKWKETDGFEEIKRNNKTVIDIDDDDTVKEGGSEDSSIEEVEAEGCGKSDCLDQKWKERDGFVEILDGKDSSDVTMGWEDGISKEVSVGKKLDSLDSDPTSDSSYYVPLYRRLFASVEKITQKLKRVHFQIGFHEKHLETHRLLRPQKKGEHVKEDLSEEAFVSLTEEEEAEISRALHISNRRKVLVTHVNSNIDITGEVLQCLRPKQWLNDEVINVYLELLKEREKREPQKFLKCHFFSTFFYKKLISGRGGYNYQSLRRWTSQKKLGYSLFDCEKIFVPIHKEIHWCLAVINKKDKKFQYLDSLRGRDTQVLKVLARYFVDEVKDKSGKDIDVRSWKQEFVEDLPEQKNGFDCGVFMVKYADFYSRDVGLCFNQEHMPYFRLRTAKEILRLKAN